MLTGMDAVNKSGDGIQLKRSFIVVTVKGDGLPYARAQDRIGDAATLGDRTGDAFVASDAMRRRLVKPRAGWPRLRPGAFQIGDAVSFAAAP